jgi:hypothetical protein
MPVSPMYINGLFVFASINVYMANTVNEKLRTSQPSHPPFRP